jgi:putative DNA primase/helicase
MAGKAKTKPLSYEFGGNHFSPEETVCRYLQFIDPGHEDWFFVLCGIANELGEPGKSIAENWSAGWQKFNQAKFASSWKSAMNNNYGRDMGVLRKLATAGGYHDEPGQKPPPPPPPDPEAIERQKRKELEDQRRQNQAAGNAGALLKLAQPCRGHDYLKRKGVGPCKGLKVMDASEAIRKGCSYGEQITRESGRLLLVPIMGETGNVQGLQVIAPDGTKSILNSSKKKEGFFVIGEKSEAGLVYVVEGLATGLSVHEATGARVHVAFDAGNLRAVAKITRRRFPEARIVIAGDLDESQTGQKKAKGAAAAVDGLAILPSFERVDGFGFGDFNDLHQAAGLEAVQAQIDKALAAPPAPEPEPAPVESESSAQPNTKESRFCVNDRGLWHKGDDGTAKLISSAIHVEAMTRNERGESWGRLLRFRDPEGREHLWACPIKLLAGDGVAFREALMEQGLYIAPNKDARNQLSIYVQTAEPGRFVHCAEQTGWTEIDGQSVFVLPDATIGEPATGTRVLYQGAALRGYAVRGELAAWQNTIGRWCMGNSRLLLAVSMGFAGPLLPLCDAEGGGLHIRGGSSSGKTTVLRAAVSVTGGPEALQRWRGTSNGLEGVACAHNHALLVLDEMGQVSPAEAGEIAYMLANGSEKLRGARTGGVREVRRWLLLFLSSGELGLADHMLSAGKRARAGQEVRLLDIPADTGKHGAFDELHGHDSGAAFSRAITTAAGQSHGHAFRAFVEKVAAMDPDELAEWLELRRGQFIDATLTGADPSGQAIRAAHRFAIIAAAGELASQFGIVPWPDGAATWGARVCFEAWLKARGGAGNQEPRDMLAQVRHFLELHGESRFTAWHCERCEGKGKVFISRDPNVPQFDKDGKPIMKDGKQVLDWGDKIGTCNMCAGTGRVLQRTVNAAGYRKLVEVGHDNEGVISHRHYLIYPEAWRVDVCAGFDSKAITALLVDRGVILTDREGKAQQKQRPPGETPRRFYVVNFDAEGWEL